MHVINNIGIFGQAFINILFAQLYKFKFVRLQQSRSLVVVDGRDVNSGLTTHFVTILFNLKDKSKNTYTKTFDLFKTKLGQYPIIFKIFWFRKHSPHICFNQNTVTFDSFFCCQHCYFTYWAIIIVGINSQFDFSPCLSTPSLQAMDFSNINDFVSDHYSYSLSYHYFHPHLLSLSAQAMTIFSTVKLSDY